MTPVIVCQDCRYWKREPPYMPDGYDLKQGRTEPTPCHMGQCHRRAPTGISGSAHWPLTYERSDCGDGEPKK